MGIRGFGDSSIPTCAVVTMRAPRAVTSPSGSHGRIEAATVSRDSTRNQPSARIVSPPMKAMTSTNSDRM